MLPFSLFIHEHVRMGIASHLAVPFPAHLFLDDTTCILADCSPNSCMHHTAVVQNVCILAVNGVGRTQKEPVYRVRDGGSQCYCTLHTLSFVVSLVEHCIHKSTSQAVRSGRKSCMLNSYIVRFMLVSPREGHSLTSPCQLRF